MKGVARRVLGVAASVAVWLIAYATVAHAHGGLAGPDELGPPVACSTALGIASYWLVVLWPPRKISDGEQGDNNIRRKIAKRKPVRRRREALGPDKEYPVRLVVNR